MSEVTFDPVPFRKEYFDEEWQINLGAHIRIAGILIARTREELTANFKKEPEVMTEMIENFADWAKSLEAYHAMLEAAHARLLVVGCEVCNLPLDD